MLIEGRLHSIYCQIRSGSGFSKYEARKIHMSNRWSEGMKEFELCYKLISAYGSSQGQEDEAYKQSLPKSHWGPLGEHEVHFKLARRSKWAEYCYSSLFFHSEGKKVKLDTVDSARN
jgi:hypothetical protein